MLSVLPPVMLLLGLMDEWIPREYFMKYMGDNSKILGILLSFTLAFCGAGPIYAAFPFAAVFHKTLACRVFHKILIMFFIGIEKFITEFFNRKRLFQIGKSFPFFTAANPITECPLLRRMPPARSHRP